MPRSHSLGAGIKFFQSKVSCKSSSRSVSPLTFHSQVVGEKIHLSHGGRLAEKTENTFKNGLVFSSRPVRVQERIRLKVERDSFIQNGALRVGFTTVPPSARSLPLPCMAIPNLTNKPGHWVIPLDESVCEAGSELEFWVSSQGSLYIGINNIEYKRLTGIDTKQPLWAMIDIYGQTRSILLLGKTDADSQSGSVPDVSDFSDDCISCLDMNITEDKVCAVCLVKEAKITLACGHRCLCKHCDSRVFQEFGTCPLCRHKI